MCEAKVIIQKVNGEEEEVMRDVVIIREEGDQLLLVDLLGGKKQISANIKEIKLIEHKVILQERQ